MHAQKILRIGGKYSFLRFRGKRPQFCEKLAQRNGYVCMCFIWRYVLQNCVKLLNFHKVSKLFKWISLSCRKTFPYILNFCIYYLLFHNYRTKVGIWTHLGHLKTFFAQGVENLISQISKSSNSRVRPGGGHVEVSNWSIHNKTVTMDIHLRDIFVLRPSYLLQRSVTMILHKLLVSW
jgi:hypothetical protein